MIEERIELLKSRIINVEADLKGRFKNNSSIKRKLELIKLELKELENAKENNMS